MFASVFTIFKAIMGCDGNNNTSAWLDWGEFPTLPPLPGDTVQPGVAGAFSGIIDGMLIIAGGANFRDEMPWRGGQKSFMKDIYVCSVNKDERKWETYPDSFYSHLAYGVSVTLPDGILCIGGCDAQHASPDVFLMRYDGREFRYEKWPSLPVPLANMSGALVDGKVYIAGGIEDINHQKATGNFFVIDINDKWKGWESVVSWPGPPRAFAVAATGRNGDNNCLYLFSGRNFAPDAPLEVLSDGYEYNPALKQWRRLDEANGPLFPFMAAAAAPAGQKGTLIFGGVSSDLAFREYNLKKDISAYTSRTDKERYTDIIDSLKSELLDFYESHSGFSRNVVLYHPATNSISELGSSPSALPVTTNAVVAGNCFIITSGEVKPGVRTPEIIFACIK